MKHLYLLAFLLFSFPVFSFTRTSDDSKIAPLFNYLDSSVWNLMDQGNYEGAEQKALTLLHYAKHVKSDHILAVTYNTLGTVQSYSGKYPDALENLFIALRLFEKVKDPLKTANVYSNIGSVYYGQEKYDDALRMFMKSHRFLEDLNYQPGIAANANNIGLVYADKNEHHKAIEYFKQSYIFDSTDRYFEGMALSYLNFGRSYFELQEYAKSRMFYNKGLELIDQLNDTYTISKLLLNSAQLDIKEGKLDHADTKIRKAMDLTIASDNPAEKRDAYLMLHKYDSTRHDMPAAYHSFRKFVEYRDRVYNEENDQRSAEAKIQYTYDKKQAIFKAEQEKKDVLQKQEQQKQTLIRNSFASGFVLLLILAGVIFRGYQAKQRANVEISKQNEEITHQKELVEEKNREIVDSINYAKRLQSAILPPASHMRSLLPESFIFYRPKDIVAGDFYFFERIGNKLFIAVADCTGHGVPGALVSVICSTALNRAVKEFRLTDPGLILDKVTDIVLETFEKSESIVSDGMDISLLVLDLSTRLNSSVTGTWSGANNGLYIKRKTHDLLEELKGDKQPIGKFDKRKPFTSYMVELEKGDKIYLYTDGYPDQFGGDKGKKFKYAQLKELILRTSTLCADQQLKGIEDSFVYWKGAYDQTDDVTLMGVTI